MIIRQVITALVYLHTPTATKGVELHNDIKPSNILLDSDLNAKLGKYVSKYVSKYETAPPTQLGVEPLLTYLLTYLRTYLLTYLLTQRQGDVGLGLVIDGSEHGRTHVSLNGVFGTTGFIDPLLSDTQRCSPVTDGYAVGFGPGLGC